MLGRLKRGKRGMSSKHERGDDGSFAGVMPDGLLGLGFFYIRGGIFKFDGLFKSDGHCKFGRILN